MLRGAASNALLRRCLMTLHAYFPPLGSERCGMPALPFGMLQRIRYFCGFVTDFRQGGRSSSRREVRRSSPVPGCPAKSAHLDREVHFIGEAFASMSGFHVFLLNIELHLRVLFPPAFPARRESKARSKRLHAIRSAPDCDAAVPPRPGTPRRVPRRSTDPDCQRNDPE